MLKKLFDILHTMLTNHFVILAVAILLFLLVIILAKPTAGPMGEMWI
jgi:hypothetical protein